MSSSTMERSLIPKSSRCLEDFLAKFRDADLCDSCRLLVCGSAL
jgi:hypothetical protein